MVGAAGRGSGRQPRGSPLQGAQAEKGKLTVGSRKGERKRAERGRAGPGPREERERRGGRLPGGGGARSGGRAGLGSGAARWALARRRRRRARGPPGSWESGLWERARAHAGPGREQPRRPRLPPLATRAPDSAPQEGAAGGPASCQRGSRPGCRGRLLLVPGPPGGAGAGARRAEWPRGADTAGHEGGGARLAVAWSREEAEGTMSGRNLHLSTTERVIKGAGRAGPSSSTRGKRPSAVRRRPDGGRGGRGGAGRRGRECGGGPWLRRSGRRTWGGVRDGRGSLAGQSLGVFCCTLIRS